MIPWDHIAAQMDNHTCRNIEELRELIFLNWQDIDERITAGLVNSMPQRINSVIKAKGGHTKY